MMKVMNAFMASLASLNSKVSRPSEPKWFGVPKDKKLVMPKRDPSQHNTLRHDQVERKRKIAKRAGRKPNKPHRKSYA